MLMALVLMTVSVALVLVGLKLIWKDEPDEPFDPPATEGHLDEGWPSAFAHDVPTVRV